MGDGTLLNLVNTDVADMISSKKETVVLCDNQFCDLLLVSWLKNKQICPHLFLLLAYENVEGEEMRWHLPP